jgi:transposase
MNRTANAPERVYCIDLAKNKFQVHVFSPSGERLQQRTLSRGQFASFFAHPSRRGGLAVMEACASSHFWSRHLQARGYYTKLVPAQFVAKQRLGNKTDGNDADGIFAVHRDPRVRPVPVKSLEQQDLCAQHRVRELLVSQRTQYINQARGLLAERGCVAARGESGFAQLLDRIASAPSQEITPPLVALIKIIVEQIRAVNAQIAVLETRLKSTLAVSPVAQRIDRVFGIGFITATAFAGEFGHGVDRFADARQFAAAIGITPSEHSSGEKRHLGSITKRGNPYLRKLLVQCAQAVLTASTKRDDTICVFAKRLLEQHKPRNTVIVAIANRLARILYAVIKHQTDYHPHAGAQHA